MCATCSRAATLLAAAVAAAAASVLHSTLRASCSIAVQL
jgi:hypothetical protein